MSDKINEILPQLLDGYLTELKAEAETIAHIAKFLEKSTASRAELSEQLRSNLAALKNSPGTKPSVASPHAPAEIDRDAETVQKNARTH